MARVSAVTKKIVDAGGLAARRAARKSYQVAVKKYAPGEGGRFKALVKSVAAGGARNPAGVAAMAGRKKYGPKRFAQMAAAGRKRRK